MGAESLSGKGGGNAGSQGENEKSFPLSSGVQHCHHAAGLPEFPPLALRRGSGSY